MNQLMSPEDLYAQLSGENRPNFVDVRGEEAYQAGHIVGALHIPADDIGASLAQIPRAGLSSPIETCSIAAGRAASEPPRCSVRAGIRPEPWMADSRLGRPRGIPLRLVDRPV